MHLRVFVLSVLFFSLVLAEEQRVFLQRSSPIQLPLEWTQLEDSARTTPRSLDVIFMLKQRNLNVLEETFWAVSNPKSPRYGAYMSLEQVADLVAPEQKVVNDVSFWLKSNGVENVFGALSRDILKIRISTKTAARLFNIEYHMFQHESGKVFECSLGPYSLPASIAQHVDFVSGIVGLPEIEQPRVIVGPNFEDLKITPEVIRARYNISNTTVCTHPNNSHAVAEFQAQYYAPTDLSTFWKDLVPFAPFRAVDKVIGQNNANQPSIEGSLDIEYIMGVAPNCTTYFYSMKSFNFFQDLTTWAAQLNNDTDTPYVHSVSYGTQSPGEWPDSDYMTRLDAEFQKLAVRGISVLFASGDDGAGCVPARGSCQCKLSPSYPAISPYVTSVGATKFLNGNTGPEGAVVFFGSGGGFAPNVFPTLSVQNASVAGYLAQNVTKPIDCAYNKTGRATPDVSALGDVHYVVYVNGRPTAVGGTSASSPTFAGVITLLNDIRLHAGKPTLGYLNPWIYQTAAANPTAFFDVTVGSNVETRCCKGNIGGFDCATGWDPVTGVGTPNFEVLKTLV